MEGERREAGRGQARLTTVLKDLDTGRVMRVLTKNLTAKGMCVITEGLLRPGTRLEVDLKLPDREAPLTLQAEVAWSRVIDEPEKGYETPATETGIAFTKLDPNDLASIKYHAALYRFS